MGKKPNPIIHGLAAGGYILLVVTVMNVVVKVVDDSGNKGFNLLAMVLFISMFTLSAAVMAYLFGYQPACLYFEGKKEEAVKFFLKTTAVFAGVTGVVLVLLVTRVFQ